MTIYSVLRVWVSGVDIFDDEKKYIHIKKECRPLSLKECIFTLETVYMLDIQPALTLCLPVSPADIDKQFGSRSGSKLFDILMFLRKKKWTGDKKSIKITQFATSWIKTRNGIGVTPGQGIDILNKILLNN